MIAIEVFYMMKGRAITLNFRDGKERTFAPSARIPERYTAKLLTKMVTIGGCCGKPQRTMHLFATREQLDNGSRKWIEGNK